MYSPLINRELNPVDEIVVTCGATEALYCAALGFIDVGDEVIVIEPYFDHYDRIISMAGGIAKYIPLKPVSTSEFIVYVCIFLLSRISTL